MAFAVATMKKLKVENLKGLERHNQRETQNHENADIDTSRSHLNYDLVNDNSVNYQKDVMGYIEQNRKSTRAVRKDAVVADEWIIGSDQKYFKTLSAEDTRRFFEESKNYFGQKFGANNIRYAMVHMDETTPHMHMGIVPLTDDGRLSSKTVFDRQTLKQVQDDFPRYMQKQGFNIDRGKLGSEKKKLSVQEYKDMQEEIKKGRQLHDDIETVQVALGRDVDKQLKAGEEYGTAMGDQDMARGVIKNNDQHSQLFHWVNKVISLVEDRMYQLKMEVQQLKQQLVLQRKEIKRNDEIIKTQNQDKFLKQKRLISRNADFVHAEGQAMLELLDRETRDKIRTRTRKIEDRLEQERLERSKGRHQEQVINLDKHPELRARYQSLDNDFQQKGPRR